MTKYGERNQWGKPADTPISLPNHEYQNRIFYCDICKHNLHKLVDSSGQNVSYYCNTCSTETFPTEENRSRSKLSVPDGVIEEPAVAYVPEHTIGKRSKKVRGSFKRLEERGMKITNYSERNWRKESND